LTGILVPAGAAAGYGISRGLMKEGRKESLKMAGYGAGATLGGAAAGTAVGLGTLAIDNAIKNKKLKKDDEKYYHKTRDQVKTAAGEMTEEEYTNKWGKTKRKK
jgi:ABC-type Na+ efflux pump permease subunit